MKYIITLILLVSSLPSHAEWYRSIGKEFFGIETSEKAACIAAEQSAVNDAMIKAVGQAVTVSQLQHCNSSNIKTEICQLLISSAFESEGFIVGRKDISRAVTDAEHARVCTIELNLDIVKDNQPDPAFNPTVTLNKKQFIHDEEVHYTVHTTVPTYITILSFNFHESVDSQVKLVYPHKIDKVNNRFTKDSPLLKKGEVFYIAASNRFGEIDFDLDIVVATKHDIKFKESYSLIEFNKAILKIPASQRRIIKIPTYTWAKVNK